jgi:predicted RNA binding protein YcfA (HicA-like mRNA interferase family)
MGKLSVLSGRDLVYLFKKFGWTEVRRKGSHIIMIKKGEIVTLSIPDHDEVAKGTLRSLLRSAGISIEEYNEELND